MQSLICSSGSSSTNTGVAGAREETRCGMRGADTANSRQCKTRQNRNTPGHPQLPGHRVTASPGHGHGRQTSGDRGRGRQRERERQRDTHGDTGHGTGHPDTDAAGEGEKQAERESRERHREGRGGEETGGHPAGGGSGYPRYSASRQGSTAPRTPVHRRIHAYLHTQCTYSLVCALALPAACHCTRRGLRGAGRSVCLRGRGSGVLSALCALCVLCCCIAAADAGYVMTQRACAICVCVCRVWVWYGRGVLWHRGARRGESAIIGRVGSVDTGLG